MIELKPVIVQNAHSHLLWFIEQTFKNGLKTTTFLKSVPVSRVTKSDPRGSSDCKALDEVCLSDETPKASGRGGTAVEEKV